MSAADAKIAVLFVCMGNICRSPAAEGVFRHYVAEAGCAARIRIDSAGTLGYHSGAPADARMRVAASGRGYTLDSVARQVVRADLQDFDLIVPMDHDNLAELERLGGGPQKHIRLLGSFIQGASGNADAAPVPDPYYGGAEGFIKVLDLLEAACPGLLAHCLALHRARFP